MAKRIGIEKLGWLFGRIETLNRSIKEGNSGIRKASFYGMKHRIILYALALAGSGEYGKGELSYSVSGKEEQALPGGCRKELVLLSITVGGKEYRFHQIIDFQMKKLLGSSLAGLEAKEYERETTEAGEALQGRESREAYKEMVGFIAAEGWFIFSYLGNLDFLCALEKRYVGIILKPRHVGRANLMRDFPVDVVKKKGGAKLGEVTLSALRSAAHSALSPFANLNYDEKPFV